MEAIQFATLDDLLSSSEERVELIDGELVRRPMARVDHGRAQGNVRAELDLIWPEQQRLVVYRLGGRGYEVVSILSPADRTPVPPFEEMRLDLGYILGCP